MFFFLLCAANFSKDLPKEQILLSRWRNPRRSERKPYKLKINQAVDRHAAEIFSRNLFIFALAFAPIHSYVAFAYHVRAAKGDGFSDSPQSGGISRIRLVAMNLGAVTRA
jgi:hypothetical protein